MAGVVCLKNVYVFDAVVLLRTNRTAEQSEGNKTVGVDPTVITARENNQFWCPNQAKS